MPNDSKDVPRYEESYYRARYDYRPTSMYWWSTRYYAKLVLKHARRRQARLLEVGYGMGHLLGALEPYFETTGVDVSDFANYEAPKNAPRSKFIQGDIAAGLNFPAGYFGVIVAKHVFEHIPEPLSALRECARLLEPGGLLLFGTPNPSSVGAGWKGKAWVGWSDATHVSVLPPGEWLRLARTAGFRIEHAFGDGLWDVPYLAGIPTPIQRAVFGLPALVQIATLGTWMPLRLGESLLVIAYNSGQ
jgi:SAM-dependent methyltransferase